MKTLVLGGTRFVGRALVENLITKGFELTLFTRGKNPLPKNVLHIEGDRNTDAINKLKGMKFDVIIDSSGRNLDQTKAILDITGPPLHRFLYVSSAGIYKDCFTWPLNEGDEIDQYSRHIGKAHTEEWLRLSKIPFTSFRPTYIYGPGNYNPIEKWFFDRIVHKNLACQKMHLLQVNSILLFDSTNLFALMPGELHPVKSWSRVYHNE